MAKLYDSRVGTGRFRLTKYKGHLIGIEIWPDVGPGETQEYIFRKFAYKGPPRWTFWIQRAPVPE